MPAVNWKDGRVVIAGDIAADNVISDVEVGTECHLADASDITRHLQLCNDRTRVTFVRTRL